MDQSKVQHYFKLLMYVDSDDYEPLNTVEKVSISNEINYMSIVLDIMTRLFSDKGVHEKAVVAWKHKPNSAVHRIYRFSCIKVASLALGCNQSKVSAVCKGKRLSTGGYVFQYEENYQQDPNLIVGEDEYKT